MSFGDFSYFRVLSLISAWRDFDDELRLVFLIVFLDFSKEKRFKNEFGSTSRNISGFLAIFMFFWSILGDLGVP